MVDPAAFWIKMKGKKRRERALKKKERELKGKCRPQNAMKSEQAYLFLVSCGFAAQFTMKIWQCPRGLVSRSHLYDESWVASPHAWPGVKWLINTWECSGRTVGGVHPPVERLHGCSAGRYSRPFSFIDVTSAITVWEKNRSSLLEQKQKQKSLKHS